MLPRPMNPSFTCSAARFFISSLFSAGLKTDLTRQSSGCFRSPSCLAKAKWWPTANAMKSQGLIQCEDHENPEISEFSRSHELESLAGIALAAGSAQVGAVSLVLRFR